MWIQDMQIVEYFASSFFITLLVGFLITMIYIIRSIIKIPNGFITWVTNFCFFTLFIFLSVCLILGLVFSSSREFTGNNIELLIKEELSGDFSLYISKHAMYPVVVVEMTIYVSLNIRLLWGWYTEAKLRTNVNKVIFSTRIIGILVILGWVVDYGIRLYGPPSFSFITTENYCACWIIFYKALFYLWMALNFVNAFIRFLCVEYPIEYHNR